MEQPSMAYKSFVSCLLVLVALMLLMSVLIFIPKYGSIIITTPQKERREKGDGLIVLQENNLHPQKPLNLEEEEEEEKEKRIGILKQKKKKEGDSLTASQRSSSLHHSSSVSTSGSAMISKDAMDKKEKVGVEKQRGKEEKRGRETQEEDEVKVTQVSETTTSSAPESAEITDEEKTILRKISPPSIHVIDTDDQTCPRFRMPSSKTADGGSIREHVSKYTRYTEQYCNKTGLLQMHVPLSKYLRFLDIIAGIAKIKKKDHIFDWGCGCGTMLNYYHTKFQTTGVGIDVTGAAIQHAKKHRQPNQTFCHMDGSDLRVFKSESFDAIVSWATLYHVRRTMVQCEIVHQMIRMLKPGGIAYLGHLRTEKTQEYWKKNKCRPGGATLVRYRDFKTFSMPGFRRHAFFSIVVFKQHESTVSNISSLPTPRREGGQKAEQQQKKELVRDGESSEK